MDQASTPAITDLLAEWSRGNRSALDRAIELLYADLRKTAGGTLQNFPHETAQATQLIHDAYLKLARAKPDVFKDRKHFLTLAAKVMRRILVDRVRESAALKRAGAAVRVPFDENLAFSGSTGINSYHDYLLLDNQLDRLEEHHPDWAAVIELRYFSGFDLKETAAALEVSVPTVVRRQRVAEAWLARQVSASDPPGS